MRVKINKFIAKYVNAPVAKFIIDGDLKLKCVEIVDVSIEEENSKIINRNLSGLNK
jgi:hypothetical protein